MGAKGSGRPPESPDGWRRVRWAVRLTLALLAGAAAGLVALGVVTVLSGGPQPGWDTGGSAETVLLSVFWYPVLLAAFGWPLPVALGAWSYLAPNTVPRGRRGAALGAAFGLASQWIALRGGGEAGLGFSLWIAPVVAGVAFWVRGRLYEVTELAPTPAR